MAFKLDPEIRQIPKAELHVHIEGTVTPAKCRELAAKNNVALAPDLFTADGTAYQYNNFLHLVTSVYDGMAQAIRTKKDYEDITYDYLKRCADETTLYVEMIAWCSAGNAVGLSYKDMIEGMATGIDRAERDTGIIGRINTTMVRHQPLEVVWEEAKTIAALNHPYIVGLDLAGGEQEGDILKFQPMFEYIFERFNKDYNRAPGMRIHFSENAGPRNGWDALTLFDALENKFGPFECPPRGGHMVRIGEDPALLKEVARRGIVQENSFISNILALIFQSYADHSFPILNKAGVVQSLNSDDPGLFNSSIGQEYQVAYDKFGMTEAQLLQFTKNSIEGAFVEAAKKDILREKIRAYETGFFKPAPIQGPGAGPAP